MISGPPTSNALMGRARPLSAMSLEDVRRIYTVNGQLFEHIYALAEKNGDLESVEELLRQLFQRQLDLRSVIERREGRHL